MAGPEVAGGAADPARGEPSGAGYPHVDPDQLVVRGREREDADQPEQRVIGCRPEDARAGDPQRLARQHVVHSQVARRLGEVGGVEAGRRAVGQVDPALQQRLSQVPGVGDVTLGGSALPSVRVELNPNALFKFGIGLEDVRAALAAANANSPKGAIEFSGRRRLES